MLMLRFLLLFVPLLGWPVVFCCSLAFAGNAQRTVAPAPLPPPHRHRGAAARAGCGKFFGESVQRATVRSVIAQWVPDASKHALRRSRGGARASMRRLRPEAGESNSPL